MAEVGWIGLGVRLMKLALEALSEGFGNSFFDHFLPGVDFMLGWGRAK